MTKDSGETAIDAWNAEIGRHKIVGEYSRDASLD